VAASWDKRILEFNRSSLLPPEECERHYRSVHARWAMVTMRDSDTLVTYQLGEMLGEWDLLGAFNQAPTLWRSAILRWLPGRGGAYSSDPAAMRRLSRDNPNFLSGIRSFEVEESVRFDRRSGQSTSAKFSVAVERPEGSDEGEARETVETLWRRLGELLGGAYGARLMLTNRVISEAEYEPIREPGQQVTGRTLPESSRVGLAEVYFDHGMWGEEFFASDPVRSELAGLVDEGLARVFHVHEELGHDKR
jgi:hypothetical protein